MTLLLPLINQKVLVLSVERFDCKFYVGDLVL